MKAELRDVAALIVTESILNWRSELDTHAGESTLHHIKTGYLNLSLLLTCAHTCDAMESASVSTEPPQGLEQDEHMGLPLANTATLRVISLSIAVTRLLTEEELQTQTKRFIWDIIRSFSVLYYVIKD